MEEYLAPESIFEFSRGITTLTNTDRGIRDHSTSSLCFLLIESDSFSWLLQTASGHRDVVEQQSDLDSPSAASPLMTDVLLGQSQASPFHRTPSGSFDQVLHAALGRWELSFPVAVSQFVFAKCPCRREDDAR